MMISLDKKGGLYTHMKEQWFMYGVICCIILAKINPLVGTDDGWLYPAITTKYIAVIFIFFCSGINLKLKQLKDVIFLYHVHIFIQLFSFIIVPIVVFTSINILQFINDNIISLGLDNTIVYYILLGFKVLSCLPPPVSSAFVLTQAAGGDQASSLFNSTLGSLLGIIISPLLISTFILSSMSTNDSTTTASSSGINVREMLVAMFIRVVLPLITGQVVRIGLENYDEISDIPRRVLEFPYSVVSKLSLLLIIYAAFCKAFIQNLEINFLPLIVTIMFVIIMHLSLLKILVRLCHLKWVNFTQPQCISVLFSSSHKSLTLGLPLLQMILGNDPNVMIAALPLMIYHPAQILLGSMIANRVGSWFHTHNVNRI